MFQTFGGEANKNYQNQRLQQKEREELSLKACCRALLVGHAEDDVDNYVCYP